MRGQIHLGGGHLIRLLALVGFWFLAGQSTHASALELQCTASGIVVQGSELQDVRDGCEAVQSAAVFFAVAGLAMPGNVSITLVDSPAAPLLASHEMGNYDARSNSIRVLAYGAALAEGRQAEPGLGRIASRDQWRSYIVHELAHAAIHLDCDKSCSSRALHEYVAAVAQLSSLPKDVLADLLGHYPDLEAFSQFSEVTETYYAINPHFFAVKSYKHYVQQAEPQAFFRRILHLVN